MSKYLKLLFNWLLGFRGTLIYCPKCKSAKVTFGETKITKLINGTVETYPVKCLDCGAEGFISETWK